MQYSLFGIKRDYYCFFHDASSDFVLFLRFFLYLKIRSPPINLRKKLVDRRYKSCKDLKEEGIRIIRIDLK